MTVPPDNSWLYAAYRVEASFRSRITGHCTKGSGTGFCVNAAPGPSYLTTCRHLVDATYSNPTKYAGYELEHLEIVGFTRTPDAPQSIPVDTQRIGLRPGAVRFHTDDTVDVAVVKLDGTTIVEPLPVRLLEFGAGLDLLATDEDFATGLLVGETVIYPGYPEWHDKNGDRPILRTGTVVSDPRSDYRKNTGPTMRRDGAKQLAFEAMSYSGNSGSPVFVPQLGYAPGGAIIFGGPYHRPMLIGVNAGHTEFGGTHSGLSYLYKSTAILDLIGQPD